MVVDGPRRELFSCARCRKVIVVTWRGVLGGADTAEEWVNDAEHEAGVAWRGGGGGEVRISLCVSCGARIEKVLADDWVGRSKALGGGFGRLGVEDALRAAEVDWEGSWRRVARVVGRCAEEIEDVGDDGWADVLLVRAGWKRVAGGDWNEEGWESAEVREEIEEELLRLEAAIAAVRRVTRARFGNRKS